MRPPEALRRAARRIIAGRLGQPAADRVIAQADEGYPEVARRIPQSGRGARHLLRLGAYAISLHDALIEREIDPEASSLLISDSMFAAIRPSRDALAMLGRLRSRDPLRRALWTSRVARRFYYTAPDWAMDDVVVEGGFGMDVTRCAVAEFFESLGRSELCERVICDQDARDAAHRGIGFERSRTLAGGADRCDFRYHLHPTDSSPRSA